MKEKNTQKRDVEQTVHFGGREKKSQKGGKKKRVSEKNQGGENRTYKNKKKGIFESTPNWGKKSQKDAES